MFLSKNTVSKVLLNYYCIITVSTIHQRQFKGGLLVHALKIKRFGIAVLSLRVLEQELCTCLFTFVNKKNISRVKCKSESVVNRKRLSRMLISVGERLQNNQNLPPESGLGKKKHDQFYVFEFTQLLW